MPVKAFRKSNFKINLTLVCCAICIVFSAPARGDANLATLNDYLDYAGTNSAELAGAYAQWQSAIEEIPQAGALPEPKFEYEFETQRTPHTQKFGIMQPLPWFGVRGARTEAAKAQAQAAKKRYDAVRLKLFNEVRQAYFDFAYLAKEIETASQRVELLKHIEEVARIRYAASMASHPDHIRAEIEISKAAFDVLTLEKQREPLVARLNAILNRPAIAKLDWPENQQYEPADVNFSQVALAIIENNPELAAAENEIAASRSQVDLAKKRSYPEFEIGVDFYADAVETMGPGPQPIMARIGLTLPIWSDSYSAAQRQARARLAENVSKKRRSQNDLMLQASQSLYELDQARRKSSLYKDSIIPRSREMLGSYEALYREGGADFTTLVEAQKMLLDSELEYKKAQIELGQKTSQLEMLMGKEVQGLK